MTSRLDDRNGSIADRQLLEARPGMIATGIGWWGDRRFVDWKCRKRTITPRHDTSPRSQPLFLRYTQHQHSCSRHQPHLANALTVETIATSLAEPEAVGRQPAQMATKPIFIVIHSVLTNIGPFPDWQLREMIREMLSFAELNVSNPFAEK